MADQGNSTVSLNSRLNEYAVGLEAMAEQEQAEAEDLALKLAVKRDQVRRIREAVQKLRSGGSTTKKKSQKSGVRASTRKALYDAVERAGEEGTTLTRLIADTGLSTDTVRRGLNVLRAENVVRRAGVNARRETLYKPMPEMASANNGS